MSDMQTGTAQVLKSAQMSQSIYACATFAFVNTFTIIIIFLIIKHELPNT